MNANNIDFKTDYLENSGVFIKNKGCFIFQEYEQFAFWVVVDGVDFVPEKESAELVAEQLRIDLAGMTVLSRGYIRKCLNNAQTLLKNASNGINLKASLILVVSNYSEIIWAVSGNCRLYLIRDHQIAFRSLDQSAAQELLDSEIIDEDAMISVADRDILTNFLGIEYGFAPFISKHYKLQDGDILILCNLGFWEQLPSVTFAQLLETVTEPGLLLPALKNQFLDDNSLLVNNYIVAQITAQQVLDNVVLPNRFRLNPKKAAMILAVLLGLAGLISTGVIQQTKVKKENLVTKLLNKTGQNKIIDYEIKADQLVKEGKYQEAGLEYKKALAILNRFPNKGPEGTIRLKTSILLMLKEGDAFLAKRQYENAINRYEAARNFDTPNYFRIQTENKIANVRQLLQAQPTKNNKAVATRDTVGQTQIEQSAKSQTERQPNNTISNNGDNNEIVKPKDRLKQQNRTDKSSETKAKNKSNASESLNKTISQPSVLSRDNRVKLNKAINLVKKANELVNKQKYRDAIRNYKKAQSFYKQVNYFSRATQLEETITATKNKMRRSFEGAH
jgi:serine/threonine protein phosphatase PrpC